MIRIRTLIDSDQAMRQFLEDDVWIWLRPDRLQKTQFSRSYYSVLDFVFVSNVPNKWKIDSKILTDGFPSQDTDQISDHRSVEARILMGQSP